MENRSKCAPIVSKIFNDRLSKKNMLTGLSIELMSIVNAYREVENTPELQ